MVKKAQVSVTFNWVYILIAGAVILLFFAGIVVRQKNVSQERLSLDVLDILESIFTGAEVSEKTKNFIETSGLADYTLQFNCLDGVTDYGIKDSQGVKQNSISPIFSPKEIKSSLLILWSLPYNLPFKVTDFLMVTSGNTKYYLLGDGNGFKDEFYLATEEEDLKLRINREEVLSLADPKIKKGENFQVRIIDFDGIISESSSVPSDLLDLDDDKVTAVSFKLSKLVEYFEKKGAGWRSLGTAEIISVDEERDAAKYAAIFAADAQNYQCNLKKALKRLNKLDVVYQGKLQEMQDYYDRKKEQGFSVGECVGLVNNALNSGFSENLQDELTSIDISVDKCLNGFSCTEVAEHAGKIRSLNDQISSPESITCEVHLY